jgi:hypothetical protein
MHLGRWLIPVVALGGQVLNPGPGRGSPAAAGRFSVQAAAPSLTREQYLERTGAVLDALIRRLRVAPRSPVLFSANLFFAHGGAVAFFSADTLIRYADALREAGAGRIEFNPSIAPWVTGDTETIDKYDALVAHIRASGLALALNPAYNATTDAGGFEVWSEDALRVYPEIARRYRPEVLVLVHEPTTQARRMRGTVSPEQWARFAGAAARAVKESSPGTRCGAGVLSDERPYFDAFVQVPDLDAISFDVYDLAGLLQYGAMIRSARAAGKVVTMEETWRPPYVSADQPAPLSPEERSAVGIGDASFERLDAKWLDALSLYAGAMGLEAFTPFWTQTFFLYVSDATGGALDAAYNREVETAIRAGARTPTFEAYRALAAERGVPPR